MDAADRAAAPGALTGIRVVDLTRYLPGPYCTRLLADLGAHVIKVEGPDGDPGRVFPWFGELSRGKQIERIDLASAAGQERLHGHLAGADVLVEGFKPASARKLGVDGASLARRYPRLVHCSISGYGQHGPLAERAGHDLNYQAEAGLLRGGGVPSLLLADVTAAYHAALRILAALVGRGRADAGALLDISLHDAARSWTPFLPPPPLDGSYACYNVYTTADGATLALGALERKFWASFCRAMGRPEWEPLHLAPEPDATRLREEVARLVRTRTAAELQAVLGPADCCATIC